MATDNLKLLNEDSIPTVTANAPAGSLADLPGISDSSRSTLKAMTGGASVPGSKVSMALTELDGVIAKQPKEFRSSYYSQLSGVMNDILGRKEFKYDLANDPMYRMYRDRHISAGRQAMEDTMGHAATLTGGYGSSYSATAGQQAYNMQLEKLNDRVPELYRLSRDAYDAEGDRLKQQYDMLNSAYQREYGAYQDQFDRWMSERDMALRRYEAELDSETALKAAGMDYDAAMSKLNADREQADREYFYDMAMDMLEMGKTPPISILRSAGLSDEDIAQLSAAKKSSSSSSKSSKKTSSSSTKAYTKTATISKIMDKLADVKSKYDAVRK